MCTTEWNNLWFIFWFLVKQVDVPEREGQSSPSQTGATLPPWPKIITGSWLSIWPLFQREFVVVIFFCTLHTQSSVELLPSLSKTTIRHTDRQRQTLTWIIFQSRAISFCLGFCLWVLYIFRKMIMVMLCVCRGKLQTRVRTIDRLPSGSW